MAAGFIIAAAAIAAGAAFAGARVEEEQARFRGKLAARNADIARRQGQFEEAALRRRAERIIAQQRAVAGAAGLSVNEGSPFELLQDTAAEAELEARGIQFRTAVNVQSFMIEADAQFVMAKHIKNIAPLKIAGAFFGVMGGGSAAGQNTGGGGGSSPAVVNTGSTSTVSGTPDFDRGTGFF